MFSHLQAFSKCLLLAVGLLLFASAILSAQTAPAGAKTLDPCTFLAKAEVQSVLSKPVKEGKAALAANTVIASTCEYMVGDDGLFSLLAKVADPAETPDAFLAGLASSKIKTEAAPGFGDRSFYAFPGYGMLQLHAFKGGQFVILTLMIPGQSEEKLKMPIGRLMNKVLAKI